MKDSFFAVSENVSTPWSVKLVEKTTHVSTYLTNVVFAKTISRDRCDTMVFWEVVKLVYISRFRAHCINTAC